MRSRRTGGSRCPLALEQLWGSEEGSSMMDEHKELGPCWLPGRVNLVPKIMRSPKSFRAGWEQCLEAWL